MKTMLMQHLYNLNLLDDLKEIHVTSLEGLGASYRIKGFFGLRENNCSKENLKIDFDAVAFGGNYGGHNINVQVSDEIIADLMQRRNCSRAEIDELISEVQRKMLNNEMIVEYDKIKRDVEQDDPLKLGK